MIGVKSPELGQYHVEALVTALQLLEAKLWPLGSTAWLKAKIETKFILDISRMKTFTSFFMEKKC